MRSRSVLLNVTALAIGLLFALVSLEVCLRLFSVALPGGAAFVSDRNFARVPGIYEPNQNELDQRVPALPFRVHINSLGYRGDEFPLSKPEGEIRVLMVGDSFTFGDFVEDDQTLPAQVQGMLRCAAPVVVVNAGMGGSSLPTQRHLIERGETISPDVVILTFYENDIADLETRHWELVSSNRAAKSRLPLSLVYPVVRHMAVWRLFQHARVRIRSRNRLDVTSSHPAIDSTGDRRWQARRENLRIEYGRELEELAASLGKRGVRLVLATYPSHMTMKNSSSSDDIVWVEEFARARGIDVVSLQESLARSNLALNELYLLPHDGHPTPRAHRIAADHLVRTIRQGAIRELCR